MVTVTVPSEATDSEYCQLSRPAVAEWAERVARADRLGIAPAEIQPDLPGNGHVKSSTFARTGSGVSPSACMTANAQSWLTSVTSSPSWPRYAASLSSIFT